MQNKKSIWDIEIKHPLLEKLYQLPAHSATWAAFFCICLFSLSPFIVGILCLIHHSIDYTIYTHPKVIKEIIWPLSALTGTVAIGIEDIKARKEKMRIKPWMKANPLFPVFFMLVIWMILSTTVNGWNSYAVNGAGLRFETIYMQLGYFLILFPAATIMKDDTKKRVLLRLHEMVSLFLVPTAFILWKTQLSSFFFQWTPSFTCIYSNINYYGYYLSVSVPLAADLFVVEKKLGWKVFSLVTMICNTIALAYNDTMGAWIACFFSMIFLLVAHGIIERRINLEVVFVTLVFFISLYLPSHNLGYFEKNLSMLFSDIFKVSANTEDSNNAGSGRWIIWKRGLILISEHPIFGIGFEGVDARNIKQFAINNRIHNEYLQYALFYGIPAGILYLTGTISVYFRALKRKLQLTPVSLACLASAFGYLVSAFFGITLFCTTPFLFIFLGMGYVSDGQTGKTGDGSLSLKTRGRFFCLDETNNE